MSAENRESCRFEFEYRDKFICYCFGGGGGNTVVQQQRPATNVPNPPGREAEQRFQQIRAGLAGSGGEATVIDPTQQAKSATVIG